MKFQQYTTYDQSKELRERGAHQIVLTSERYYVVVPPDEEEDAHHTLYFLEDAYSNHFSSVKDMYVRAYSLQEMLHELMAHYSVRVTTRDSYGESIVTLWELGNKNTDYVDEKGFIEQFDESDTFTAVYDAYGWHLTQKK